MTIKRRLEKLEAAEPENMDSYRVVFHDECELDPDCTPQRPGERVIVTTFVAAEKEWLRRLSSPDRSVAAPAWGHLFDVADTFNQVDAAIVDQTGWRPAKKLAWALRFDPARYAVTAGVPQQPRAHDACGGNPKFRKLLAGLPE